MKLFTRFTWFIVSAILVALNAQGQITLERVKVTKEISMEIPTTFSPMSQSEVINRYVSARAPLALYSDPGREVDIGINENSSPWVGSDLTVVKDIYKANILNLFTEVNFIQEDIREIGGREFVVFEFVSKTTDEQSAIGDIQTISKYTYILYTIRNGKVLLFNFTSPARQRSYWQEAAAEIMESIRIK